MWGNRCVISFFLPTSVDQIFNYTEVKRRAEQELGQWVSVACWKSGDLGSFPYSPTGMPSDILCLVSVKCVYLRAKMLSELVLERKYLDKLVMFQQGVFGSDMIPVRSPTTFLSLFTFCFVSCFLPFCCEVNPACRKRRRYQRSSWRHVTVSFPQLLLLCLPFCSFICSVISGVLVKGKAGC